MKDPAFLFYPNDWLGGTLGMTFEEKGAYMELLMLQFNRGHMSGHMIAQTVGQIWIKIQDKFKIDDKGLYYNERLEIEKNKRKAFTQSRRNNLKGINQYTKKQKNKGHVTSHMENENKDENINKIINEDNIIKIYNLLKAEFFQISIETIKKEAELFINQHLVSTDTNQPFYEYMNHFINKLKKQYPKCGKPMTTEEALKLYNR